MEVEEVDETNERCDWLPAHLLGSWHFVMMYVRNRPEPKERAPCDLCGQNIIPKHVLEAYLLSGENPPQRLCTYATPPPPPTLRGRTP